MKDTRTDEELNRIIAEWMGWKRGHSVRWMDDDIRSYDWGWTPPKELAFTSIRYTPGKSSCVPSDYCSDLNAMREAERKLWALADAGNRLPLHAYLRAIKSERSAIFAEAREKAEALVAVIEGGTK